jgi:hypothetical protein
VAAAVSSELVLELDCPQPATAKAATASTSTMSASVLKLHVFMRSP